MMKKCPNCGHRDNPYWRHSRFDFNADYMREDDFTREFPELFKQLPPKPQTLTVGLYGIIAEARKRNRSIG